jgi:hypothetical protein
VILLPSVTKNSTPFPLPTHPQLHWVLGRRARGFRRLCYVSRSCPILSRKSSLNYDLLYNIPIIIKKRHHYLFWLLATYKQARNTAVLGSTVGHTDTNFRLFGVQDRLDSIVLPDFLFGRMSPNAPDRDLPEADVGSR